MSMKNDFTMALNHSARSFSRCRDEIIKAMNNKEFSVIGKQRAVNNIIEGHNNIVTGYKAEIISAITEKINFLDGDERETLNRRYRDVNYRAALANTLDVLSLCAGEVAPDDVKTMLAMFENDPMAITAIKKTIGRYTKENGGSGFVYTDIIPADNRGKRQERLRKIETTIIKELDEMTLSTPSHGLDEHSANDTFDPHEIPEMVLLEVSSTVDYMSHCNDDLTEYTPEAATAGIDVRSAYNSAFNA